MRNSHIDTTVLFYGPIGGRKGNIIGGGESGNRKTISILKRMGLKIRVIEKPYPIKIFILGGLLFPIQFLIRYFTVVFCLIKERKTCNFHLSGFYNHLIYMEWLLIKTAKLFRIRTVYELRAGGAIEGYESRSNIYRFFFRQTISCADIILCQGKDYIPFLKRITNVNGLYYPNYIQNEFFYEYNDNQRSNKKKIEIIYFGRIAPSKNIEFIIDICRKLKYDNFSCEIIGGGDREYISKLNKIISDADLTSKCVILPPISSTSLFPTLQRKHFFLFPSREKREGHSNSLTEAMSSGVVPIASDAGFNKTVIQDTELIINIYDANLYAGKIDKIINSGKWSHYSFKSYEVVKNCYTEAAVESVLIKAHMTLDNENGQII